MWRWLLLVVLVVLVSAAGAWFSLRIPADVQGTGGVAFPTGQPVAGESRGPLPKVELEGEPVYQFGVMAQQTKGSHEWKLTNAGPGVLKLTGTQPACSCTVVDPKPDETVEVAPGATYTIKVEWETRQFVDKFEKNARVLTSDPERPDINFIVKGEVQPAILTDPLDGMLNVGNLSNDAPHSFTTSLTSPDRPDVQVTGVTTTRPDLLEVSYAPLKPDELSHSPFKAGWKVDVVVKASPVLGAFREEVVVKTDHPLRDEVRFMVVGRMMGPVAISPPTGLRMTEVAGPKGASGFVTLAVRGQDETQFEVLKAPRNLQVKVTPMATPARTEGVPGTPPRRYRVDVTVPAGSPPGVIEEPIMLKTSHPMAREVEVPVYIRVLGGG